MLKVIIIGGTKGIGLATARAFVLRGSKVIVVARNKQDVNKVAQEIGGYGISADITDIASVESMRAKVFDIFSGAPDILVNSAGTFMLKRADETSIEEFQDILNKNLVGFFMVIRAFLPHMIDRGYGHIISIGSVAGKKALPFNAAYAASKYGLRGLHEVLSQELTGTGVRVTLIEPGAVDTPLWDKIDFNQYNLPSRYEMLSDEDVASAIVYAAFQPKHVEVVQLELRSVGKRSR